MAEGDRPNGPDTGGPQPPGIEQGADEGLIQTFLIADVRGYTSFSQEHGDEAAGRLAGRFADVTTQVVEAGGGAVLELRGDEALCIFSTTRRAIRAAVDLQDRFLAETQSDPTLPLPVGIGIDTGEAVPVAGGFRGRALNLAARLCGSARAGEILATREAIHISGRMDGIRIEDRGVSSFKGIPEPVGVIRVTGEGEDPARWFADHAPSHPTSRRSTRRRLGIAALAALLVAAVAIRSSEAQPAGNVDRIELSLGIDPEAQVDAVTAGDADVAFGAASTGRLDQLLVRYPAQIHISPYPMTSFIDLNSALPPFNDVRARRALNYAVDRRQVVRILGGDAHVSVTCQQLPPNFPSYAPYCPYTRDPGPRGSGLWSGADVEKARDLVRRSDTTGMQVTVEHTAGFQVASCEQARRLVRLRTSCRCARTGAAASASRSDPAGSGSVARPCPAR